MSPYWQKEFFPFCTLFFHRLWKFATGQLPLVELAPDEIQIFVLSLLSVSCALVGTFLVLKKMTMLANSLSHTILLGIAFSYLIVGSAISLKTLLIASLVSGLLTSLTTHWLTHVMRLQEDASIGLVFTAFFALGVLLITLFTRNAHIGTEAIMGNVDALHFDDLKLAFTLFLFNLLIVGLLYKHFIVSAFDQALATLLGLFPRFCSLLLMFLISCTAVGAFRAVGVLLFLALLVGPVLSARLLTHRLSLLILLAALFGCLASFLGVALARHILSVYSLALSTAGLIVLLIGLFFASCCFIKTYFKQRLKGVVFGQHSTRSS